QRHRAAGPRGPADGDGRPLRGERPVQPAASGAAGRGGGDHAGGPDGGAGAAESGRGAAASDGGGAQPGPDALRGGRALASARPDTIRTSVRRACWSGRVGGPRLPPFSPLDGEGARRIADYGQSCPVRPATAGGRTEPAWRSLASESSACI